MLALNTNYYVISRRYICTSCETKHKQALLSSSAYGMCMWQVHVHDSTAPWSKKGPSAPGHTLTGLCEAKAMGAAVVNAFNGAPNRLGSRPGPSAHPLKKG